MDVVTKLLEIGVQLRDLNCVRDMRVLVGGWTLVGWVVGRSLDWLVAWLVTWLVGWSVA